MHNLHANIIWWAQTQIRQKSHAHPAEESSGYRDHDVRIRSISRESNRSSSRRNFIRISEKLLGWDRQEFYEFRSQRDLFEKGSSIGQSSLTLADLFLSSDHLLIDEF